MGKVSERGGTNAVRSLLESRGLVVDEFDGRADYGRDLNVDTTTASRVMGGIIGVQVRGGSSFTGEDAGLSLQPERIGTTRLTSQRHRPKR